MTFNATDVNVTCCNLDGTPMSVTCGQGLSCAASCFSLEATLCPSHNCEACATFGDLTNDDQRQGLSSLASWDLKHCPGLACPVGNRKECCFHPTCQEKEWQRNTKAGRNFVLGTSIGLGMEYALNDKFSLLFMPNFNYSLSNINAEKNIKMHE